MLEKTKSAQVKTALIFAGLGSHKWSNISYNKFTRDHTEQIMNDIGFNIKINIILISIKNFIQHTY